MPGLSAGINSLVAQSKSKPSDIGAQVAAAIAAARGAQGVSGTVGGDISNQLWYGKSTPKIDVVESGGARPTNLPMKQTIGGGRTPTTVDTALNLPYRWLNNPTKLQKMFAAVSEATGQPVTDFFQALDIWQSAVKAANASWVGTKGGKNGTPLTPWTALDLMKRSAGTSLSKTETHKSISDVSEGTAWTVVQDAAKQLLGRAATSDELREFTHKANQIAANNPSITTTTTDSKGNTSQKTKGGVDGGDLQLAAANMANANPEAGAFQAAGPLYNAFLDAISNPF